MSKSKHVARGIKASFWRGGTSNGILINAASMPMPLPSPLLTKSSEQNAKTTKALEPMFAKIFGSPDPYGRQLNGMGGGISSLSKAMIIDKSSVSGVDVDYTFFQIGITDGILDTAGNCGNMSSAVGPFAINEKMFTVSENHFKTGKSTSADVFESEEGTRSKTLTARLRNTNTNKIVEATFQVRPNDDNEWDYLQTGRFAIDGVPGLASPIELSFLQPAGSKTGHALPTGNTIDMIRTGSDQIRASLVDVSNAGIFIDGRDVGWNARATADELNANAELLNRLDRIRKAGTEMMGLDPSIESVPKLVLVFPPPDSSDVDIHCQALSMGKAHKAVPVTLALNLGVSCKLPGTLPYELCRQTDRSTTIIGHPSGQIETGADIEGDNIIRAKLFRTARCHMDGYVNVE